MQIIIPRKRFKSSIWPIDKTLTGTSRTVQRGSRCKGNEVVFHIPQRSRTGASPPESLLLKVLPFCRSAVGVVCSSKRLGSIHRHIYLCNFSSSFKSITIFIITEEWYSHAGNIIAWVQSKRCKSRMEWSKGRDRTASKAVSPHSQARWKVYRQKVDVRSYRVVSKIPKTTTRKTFTTRGRRNCQTLQTWTRRKWTCIFTSKVKTSDRLTNKTKRDSLITE